MGVTAGDAPQILRRFLEHVSDDSVRAAGGSKEAARRFLDAERRRPPPDLAQEDFRHLEHRVAELAGQLTRGVSATALCLTPTLVHVLIKSFVACLERSSDLPACQLEVKAGKSSGLTRCHSPNQRADAHPRSIHPRYQTPNFICFAIGQPRGGSC